MFTGLVERTHKIASFTPHPAGIRLDLESTPISSMSGNLAPWEDLEAGESISVNGACLTLVSQGTTLGFDVIPETMRCTSLGQRQIGEGVQVILKFKTKFGHCEGVVRLYEDLEVPRMFKAWNFLTTLSDLNSSFNKKEDEYENTLEGPNWLDVRTEDRLYKDRDPEVLVVGSGQAGLSIAARLKQQNIDTLVIDKNERVGDNWRNRYHSLKLHNQTHVNHLPYMPFPSTWPTYIPKDKLAGWFEYYAESMELNVWTKTTFISAEYDEAKKNWKVILKLSDGNERIIKPKHIVMAVGVSSVPNRNKIPGMEGYKGKVIHSADYNSGKDYKGKNVLVYGTGTSAHDVAQDLYVHGANVKIVQRSPSMVVNVEPSAQLPYQLYKEGPNTDDCDLITISSPLEVLKKTHHGLLRRNILPNHGKD